MLIGQGIATPLTMKALLLFVLLVSGIRAHASDAPQCRSQLLRVSVAQGAITGVAGSSVTSILRNVAPNLATLLQRSYDLPDIALPPKKEECAREGVDCSDQNFCSRHDINPELKKRLCFALPCPLFEGSRQVGKCKNVSDVFGTTIGFPQPVNIEKLAWDIKSIDYVGKDARLCFRINELSLSLVTQFNFDTTGTDLTDHSVVVTNISGSLDKPKDICLTAKIDLALARPISQVKIVHQSTGPFISDELIRNVARNVQVSGLTGYSATELRTIVPEIMPVLLHPLRESLELSIADALGKVLEDQVASSLTSVASSEHPLVLDSSSFMSELSITPPALWQSIAYQECRQLVFSGKQIPADHACIGLDVTFTERLQANLDPKVKITTSSDIEFFMKGWTLEYDLSWPSQRFPNVVSELLRKSLIKLKTQIEAGELSSELNGEEIRKVTNERRSMIRDIDTLTAQILAKRESDNVFKNIEVIGDLLPGVRRTVSLSIPGMCSATVLSTHAAANIPNCPIQAYVDINEFNKVLGTLWSSGRMCNGGKGTECQLPTDLIGCNLHTAPQLKYLGASGRYSTDLKLRQCRKELLPFGIFGAHVSGDFNVSLSFKPKSCHNGDFCIDQPRVTWALLPGTGTGVMSDPFLRAKVTTAINGAINESMSKTFRIPLATATSGFLSQIPLKAEGRTKSGAGYFGVCFKEDRKFNKDSI